MRRWRRCAAALAILVVGAAILRSAGEARANSLAADLSAHLIAITTAFVGTQVVAFGVAESGHDVIVTVQGPREDLVVRRKSRIAGVWINRDQLAFRRVPAYYAVASTGPLEEIARPAVLAQLEIGTAFLDLEPVDASAVEISEIEAFRDALVRRKQEQGLYSRELFRTNLVFPANVPPGIYQVQVFELQDGFAGDAQRSTLVVSKVGFEADIYDFAQHRAALYGLAAIALAVVAGWLAGVMFRRG
jgi:uncharacterized protein (TIGR02186 family)